MSMFKIIGFLLLIILDGLLVFDVFPICSDSKTQKQGYQPKNAKPEWTGETVRSDGNIAQKAGDKHGIS